MSLETENIDSFTKCKWVIGGYWEMEGHFNSVHRLLV